MAQIIVVSDVEKRSFQINSISNPTSQVIQLDCYRLFFVDGDSPKNYRVFRGMKRLGLVFEHKNYWSNGVDSIKYAEAFDAVLGLDDWRKLGRNK